MRNVMQLGMCLVGRHARDRRGARFDGEVWHSHCTGCGRAMYRDIGGWKMGDGPPPPADPAEQQVRPPS